MRRLLRSIGLFLFEDYVNFQVENMFRELEREILRRQQYEHERRRLEEQIKFFHENTLDIINKQK